MGKEGGDPSGTRKSALVLRALPGTQNLFPLLVGSFCVGSILGSLDVWPFIWPIFTIVTLSTWLILLRKGLRRGLWAVVALVCFLALGGWNQNRLSIRYSEAPFLDASLTWDEVQLEGLVADAPKLRPDGVRFVLEIYRARKGGLQWSPQTRALITVREGGYELKYGDLIRTRTRLRFPESPLNPGEIDRSRRLLRQGITLTGTVPDGDHILIVRRAQGTFGLQALEDLRWRLTHLIRTEFPVPSRDILLALIVGQSGIVDQGLRDIFSSLGIAHLLAISGLHFGLLAWWTHAVLRFLFTRFPRLLVFIPLEKLCWALAIPVVFAYAGIAGLSPSVKRALLMTLALGVAILTDRVRRLYHALALAALIILLMDPGEIFDLSFQLSFLAVFGILYLLPILGRWMQSRDRFETLVKPRLPSTLTRGVLLAAGTTISATLATLPLAVNRFHIIPVLGVPANLLFIPLIGWVVLPVAFLGAAITCVLEPLGVEILWIAAWISDRTVTLAQWMGSWSPKIYLPSLRPWEIGLFYFSIFLLAHLRWKWKLRSIATVVCLAVAWLLIILRPFAGAEKGLKAHFIAVGNGASILLELPEGKNILIDGGGTHDNVPDIGSMVVAPALWELGISRLHRIILTHPHPDHINGLVFILKAFPVVDGVWDNGDRPRSETYTRFWNTALAQGRSPQVLCEGDQWELHGVRIQVFNPPCQDQASVVNSRTSEVNNRSLVLKVSWKGVSFLLPGDINADRELLLASSKDLSATVLMAPHHGSKTSSTKEFIDAVRPRFVVFSSKAGHTGLASQEIIERYRKAGVLTFHTGEDGMVSFVTDESGLRVETFRGKRLRASNIVDLRVKP